MKDHSGKINRLLQKAFHLMEKAAGSKPAQKEKVYDKAEGLCRRAMERCPDGSVSEISCAHALAFCLYSRGKASEALEPLEKIYGRRKEFAGHPLLPACLGYYGSILCEEKRFDPAAEALDELLGLISVSDTLPEDVAAVCLGLGNAGAAFTWSDTDQGYDTAHFTRPVELLLALEARGIDSGADNMKKAAYFAASQQLFLTCYYPVTENDAKETLAYLARCVDACGKSGKKDIYLPAAMRLSALAMARACKFSDCAEMCGRTLQECSGHSGDGPGDVIGSIQSIEGDMNLLLGVLNCRARNTDECIRYFEAAMAAFEADAQGSPLAQAGYAEAEEIIMKMSSAEKCAFASQYIGMAKLREPERFAPAESVSHFRRCLELLDSIDENDPCVLLSKEDVCIAIARAQEMAGDKAAARDTDILSMKHGVTALLNHRKGLSDDDRAGDYLKEIRARRRTALRLGLLERYMDYMRFEKHLYGFSDEYKDPLALARYSYDMGECCRVLGRYESALDHYREVKKNTFDGNGVPKYDVVSNNFHEIALVSSASCYVKVGEMSNARRAFREFADIQLAGPSADRQTRAKIAALARDVELNPAECALYMQEAASAHESCGADNLAAAELYNQEGICWYNASPGEECESDNPAHENDDSLAEEYARRELEAFENSRRLLITCDPENEKVLDLMPSLLSNIGECHLRAGDHDKALECYTGACKAFEKLFATGAFCRRPRPEREFFALQYAVCFKTTADIYNELERNEECVEALSRAISVLEQLESRQARSELSVCLNARGVVWFRLGEYRKNVEDTTRAIELKKNDDSLGVNMAIMLKNRSDAYRELGDFRSMQKDLTSSIEILDKSELPDEMLSPIYGSNWFSMGLCQEGLNHNGKAADAYRRAAVYMDMNESDGTTSSVMNALCHYRRAVCLCRRDEQEYYGALYEYNKAIRLIEKLPDCNEKNENLRQLLSSRGSLYEAFREIDLAKADYSRAESLTGTGKN